MPGLDLKHRVIQLYFFQTCSSVLKLCWFSVTQKKGFTCKSLSDLMFTVKTAGFEVSGQVNDYDGYQGQINKHLERDTHRWTETKST